MKKIVALLVAIGTITSMSSVYAVDLLDVFHHAQASDQTYKSAEATYMGTYTTLDQSKAKLLPNLGLTGGWTRTIQTTNTDDDYGGPTVAAGNALTKNNAYTYTLTLTQPLFNWQAFKAYDQVKLNVKYAAATYAAAAQDLIMRTATAYFDVLEAQDVVNYTAVQEKALYRQLQVAQQRYNVGLDAITAVYDSEAQYDAMRANYIASENAVSNKKEVLRTITNQLYASLNHLKDDFPLLNPQPADIDQWTHMAEEANTTLAAQRYAALAAEAGIKVQSAQHLPTLDFTGTYGNTNTRQDSPAATQYTATGTYGLALTAPIYTGGNVDAEVKQAQYQYQGAVAQLDLTHRQTVSSVRQAYLGVIADISQIEADREGVKSARAALASNEAGYRVGTQTILNVLTAQSTLYQAETTYTKDRYSYVINTLTLKQAAGTLNENDVIAINQWLTDQPIAEVKPVPINLPAMKKKVDHKYHKKHTSTKKKVVKQKHVPAKAHVAKKAPAAQAN